MNPPPGGRERVIGIDPGLAATGWAVLEPAPGKPRLVACGTIRTSAAEAPGARLVKIARGLREAVALHGPHLAAVEQALVAKGARSAIALGEARGVAILVAAEAGLAVEEVLPMHVKQAATGYGHAAKEQVERMVPHLVALGAPPDSAHAADAIAIALCGIGRGAAQAAVRRGRGSTRAAWTAFAARAGR